MANSCLVVLCGLPAVGKSTFASNIAEAVRSESRESLIRRSSRFWQHDVHFDEWRSDIHTIHVCFDDIIPEHLYSNENSKDIKLNIQTNGRKSGEDSQRTDSCQTDDTKEWKKYRKFISQSVEHFISTHSEFKDTVTEDEQLMLNEQLDYVYRKMNRKHVCSCWDNMIKNRRCCRKKHIIIIDDNMFYSSMRYEYYQIARKYSIGFLEVYVTCDMENLLEQNSKRRQPIPGDTIHHMTSIFEKPNPKKFEWESNNIEFNSKDDDLCDKMVEVFTVIQNCFENPVKPLVEENLAEKEAACQINLQNILHQADQVIRKEISSRMQHLRGLCESKVTLRKESLELNTKKKSFLNSLKASNETLKKLDMYLIRISKDKTSESESGHIELLCNDEVSKPSKNLGRNEQTDFGEDNLVSRKNDFESNILCLFNDFMDGSALNL